MFIASLNSSSDQTWGVRIQREEINGEMGWLLGTMPLTQDRVWYTSSQTMA